MNGKYIIKFGFEGKVVGFVFSVVGLCEDVGVSCGDIFDELWSV